METVNKLFAFFESTDFRQRSQIINSLSSFTTSIETSSQYEAMLEHYKPYPKQANEILTERIDKLLALRNDTRYLNKYDSAIAAYLYLLYHISPTKFSAFAKKLALPTNMWWTSQMLVVLLRLTSSSKTQYAVKAMQGAVHSVDTHSTSVVSYNTSTATLLGEFK